MSDPREESTPEAAVEGTDASVLNVDKFLNDEAEEKRWREGLDNQRAAMGDAEEICVFFVQDLLLAIFQEMQVRLENASLFAMSARQMCLQAFESVDMSAFEPSESLDRIRGPTEHGRQQVLKRQSKWWASRPQRNLSSSILVSALPPPTLFLRRLLNFLEQHADRANLELQRFRSSHATSLSGKRKIIGIGSTDGAHGHNEWCISVDQIPVFLQELLSKGLVSAVPSTITFVMAVNRESLDKKLHSQARVALPQLQQFVQKALLTAEEEEETNSDPKRSRPPVPESMSKTDNESTPRSRIFQTEVPLNKVMFGDASRNGMKSAEAGPDLELLSSYLEEVPPRAIEMDRRAPGQIGKKAVFGAANPSQRALSRKVMLLLAPPPRQGSRWKTVRHKLIVPPADTTQSGVTTITAEADMVLKLAGGTQATSTPSISVKRKATVLPVQAIGIMGRNEEMPDAAALSNIFSLGTPRQLSAQELARRNDLLAQLEREAIRAQRRVSTTVIASMSLGSTPGQGEDGAVCSSLADHQQFQAYVAANSTIMMGVQPGGHSPTRPHQCDQGAATRNRGKANVQRSKFELERDTLSFTVSDGTSHEREVHECLSAAICSPIKRPRASVIAPTPPPETSGRPIQTPSTLAHLPHLDSSRLAVGVSAVVHGVEKRGPRRNPSRKSRLQLHNYSVAFEGVDDPDNEVNRAGSQLLVSPVRVTGPTARGAPAPGTKEEPYRLPVIPGVSPIKASPHRKHVAFKFQNDERIPAPISPKAQMRQQPSVKVKQAVWEATTQSPPRTRNHHFASGRNFRKIQRYEEESSSARRLKQEELDFNTSHQPMAAPRRSVLPSAYEYDDN